MSSKTQRSWTASEEKGSGKWLTISVLLVLLVVLLAILLPNLFVEDEPSSYAIAAAVTEYTGKNVLPDPAFAEWGLGDFSSGFASRGLEPWQVLDDKRIINIKNEFDLGLEPALKQAGAQPRDTLIIYLRCHAIVLNDRPYALAGDFGAEDAWLAADQTQTRAIAFDDLFQQFRRLPVANVVLLADVCDLQSVPQLGTMANNVVERIGTACQLLPDKEANAARLWVITAAAPLQPHHESYLRRQTLLQAAVDYACNPANSVLSTEGGRFLSLSQFYESIVRYSHSVTRAAQTPWMFCSGTKGNVTPRSTIWQVAQETRVARGSPDGAQQQLEELQQQLSEAKTAGHFPKRPAAGDWLALNRVNYRYQPPQAGTSADSVSPPPTADAAGSNPTAEGTTSGTTAGTEGAPEVSPPLRYWQLRDALLERSQNPGGWSGVDIDLAAWQRAQSTMLSLERRQELMSLADRSTIRQVEDMQEIIRDLEQLAAGLASSSATSSAGELSTAWNRLQAELDPRQSPDSGKQPWQDPAVLPDALQRQWQPIRARYRSYMDATANLSGWLKLALEDGANWLEPVERYVDGLRSVAGHLPANATDAAIEFPLDDDSPVRLQGESQTLRSQFDNLVQQTLDRLQPGSLPASTPKLQWADEYRIQSLLGSSLLTYPQRKQLSQLYNALDRSSLLQPGEANNVLDTRRPLEELLANPGSDERLRDRVRWSGLLRTLVGLALPANTPPAAISSNDAATLNAWGRDFVGMYRSPIAAGPAMAWHQACLTEWGLFQQDLASSHGSGLLIAVSSDTSIDVQLPRQVQLPESLRFIIKRRNGALIGSCCVVWRLLNANDFSVQRQSVLDVRNMRGERLSSGDVHRVLVVGGQVELQLSSELTSLTTQTPIQLELEIAEDETFQRVEKRQIEVSPANPDRVELYAKGSAPSSSQGSGAVPRSLLRALSGSGSHSLLSGLRVPGIDGNARAIYELFAYNVSDEDKVVQATLYDVQPGSGQLIGNGRITLPAIQRTTELLVGNSPELLPRYVSDPVTLPRNREGVRIHDFGGREPANRQRLQFKPVVSESTNNPPGDAPLPSASIGEFGLLCVIEEVSLGENNAVRVLEKEPTLHWIEIEAENPVYSLAAMPKLIPTPQAFKLAMEVPRPQWGIWNVKELNLRWRLTDQWGKAVEFSEQRGGVMNEQKTSLDWTITPDVPPNTNTPLVVHVDVGGYPRAINLRSRLGANPDEARSTPQSFLWVEPRQLTCQDETGKDLPLVMLDAERVLVPNRVGASGDSLGTAVVPTRVQLPIAADFRADKELRVTLGKAEARYGSDRQILPRFSLQSGNLLFAAGVRDLTFVQDIQDLGLRGMQRLQVEVVGDAYFATGLDVLFDREPPERSKVVSEARELYLEDAIRFFIDLVDDSRIEQVYFAIDSGNTNPDNYDEKDLLRIEGNAVSDGRWMGLLSGTPDLNTKLVAGENFRVVCRSIDAAGNVRDDHASAVFRWTNQKRPVDKPKPKPPAATKPAPKPEPTEFTIVVRVKVDNAPPQYPEKTAVSGLPGSTPAHGGNGVWTIPKVPKGSYEVTATYTDPFGAKYEGKTTLTVSANSRRDIEINTQRP